MKKTLVLIASLLLLSGCKTDSVIVNDTTTATEITTESVSEIQTEGEFIVDTVTPVESAEDFLDMDIFVDVPKESENKSYSILNNKIAQIDFQYKQIQYLLRVSTTVSKLDFDIDDEYKQLRDMIDNGKYSVDICTTEGDCKVAFWQNEGKNYMLASQQPVETSDFMDICSWIAYPG